MQETPRPETAPVVAVWVNVPVALFFALVIAAAVLFETVGLTPAACAADDPACRAAAAVILVASALSLFTAMPHAFNLLLDSDDELNLLYIGLVACCEFCFVGMGLTMVVHVTMAAGVEVGAACLAASALLASGLCVYAKQRNPHAYRMSAGTGLVGCCAVLGMTLNNMHAAALPAAFVLAIAVAVANAHLHGGVVVFTHATATRENTRDTRTMLLLSILTFSVMRDQVFFCNGAYDAFEVTKSVAAFAMVATVLVHVCGETDMGPDAAGALDTKA